MWFFSVPASVEKKLPTVGFEPTTMKRNNPKETKRKEVKKIPNN